MLIPRALQPGDTIDAVAPSSPFDRTLAWRGLGWLAERYHVRFDSSVFDTEGYLAGSDERRVEELNHAFRCPTSRAIVAMRGGYGLNRIAHKLDWAAFRGNAKWIVGFSDITALHVEVATNEIASIHAPMLATLGRGEARIREAWIQALEQPTAPQRWSELPTVWPGQASGPTFGGNLAMLHACAVAGRLHVPTGAILFLEDVGERPYRVDRTLTTLLVGGHFEGISGVVLGEFLDCDPGQDGTHVDDVLKRGLAPLGVPIVSGAPFGHGLNNKPIHFGMQASLRADSERGEVIVNG